MENKVAILFICASLLFSGGAFCGHVISDQNGGFFDGSRHIISDGNGGFFVPDK